jgi:predicted transcriptional regulator
VFEAILGSASKERVLIYLSTREQGYARDIARFFNSSVSPIQKQLEALEEQGVLYSQQQGRTLLYSFNPRYPLIKELRALLEKALTFYSPDEQERLLMNRRRPRRKGKPLTTL